MTTPPPGSTRDPLADTQAAVKLLATLDSLHLKAFAAENRDSLIFIMLNDSAQIATFDRAMLWDMRAKKPELIGLSGQREAKADTPFAKLYTEIVQGLKNPQQAQILEESSFTTTKPWSDLRAQRQQATIYWLPLIKGGKIKAGLWFERWDNAAWNAQEIEALKFLGQGYTLAWDRFSPKLWRELIKKKHIISITTAAVIALVAIRIPLRVVAPCEIVAADPTLITAPLEGIIGEIKVLSGQQVSKGTLLLQYDKEVILQSQEVAQKEMEIADAELKRATSKAFSEPDALAQIGTLHLQLQKQKVNLGLANYRVSQLDVIAPTDGVVSIDDPESWRGKPVQMGERVMTLSQPSQTKLRIWIPEDDNVDIRSDLPIRIVLNVNPEKSQHAKLRFISNHTRMSDLGITSFVAEADWTEVPANAKTGLKGTAVLYGDRVSLFYWLMRRPWGYLRRITGL